MDKEVLAAWERTERHAAHSFHPELYLQSRAEILRRLQTDGSPLSPEEQDLAATCLALSEENYERAQVELRELQVAHAKMRSPSQSKYRSKPSHVERIA